jgi:nucleoside-diphosphate-sugar epimerase
MNTTTPPADVLVVGAGGVFGWPAIRLLLDRGGAVRGRAQPARPRPLR